ncbi:MAG TPA: cytochrome P450 [Acidimicrobiales bacterium]|jgi:cytochrome P450|nr:cytochrome P450 [Acidimicrobiales bacterium]
MASFDPNDPRHLTEGVPFDRLAQLRREAPVCPTPSGSWYVARYDDVEASLRSVGTFRADLGRMSGVDGVEAVPSDQLFLSEISGPRHAQIRRLFNATFGPQRTAKVEPFIRSTCHGLVDQLLTGGDVDLDAGYAMPIPGLVMAHMMGLPDGTAAKFMAWSVDGMIMKRPCSPDVGVGNHPLQNFFAEELAARRARTERGDDVFTTLIDAEIEGEPLSDQEIVTELHFMIQAGVHTTRGLLAHLVQRLLLDRDLYQRLRSDPSLVPAYMEESLRFDAPVQRTTRRCTAETDIEGVALRPGDWVEMGIASANRDDAVFDDPESFRLDRPDPRGHLTFGAGPHVCPGASLARLEGLTAVEVLMQRVSCMEPVDGATYPPLPGNLGHLPIPARLVAPPRPSP